MSYLEILGLYVTAAGTLASILGIFFAIYAKQNGKNTREFIAAENRKMEEFLAKTLTFENRNMCEFIASETRNMQEFIANVFDKIDKRASERHIEVMAKL